MSNFHDSYAWKKKRREIKSLYKNKCAICGVSDSVEAHHIISVSILPDLKLDNNNIIALCSHCHKMAHNNLISPVKLNSMVIRDDE